MRAGDRVRHRRWCCRRTAWRPDDLNLKVIDLPTLIEIKSSTGRVRDRLVVPLLLALLREREKPPQG